jgi:hypothetical protein
VKGSSNKWRYFIISPFWPLERRLWRIALPLSGSQPNSEI